MLEPKYDEDVVNLGYLKKVINNEVSDDKTVAISKHYASKPSPPYYIGDTWKDGDVVYTCINTRIIGMYQQSDWVTVNSRDDDTEIKNKVYLTQPSNYNPGDMWILQSDDDHRAGKRGEMLISTAGRSEYDADDWVNMLGYGTIRSINEVANNINDALKRLKCTKEEGKVTIYYMDAVPSNAELGDLWYVTETVDTYLKENLYKYNGSEWETVEDSLAIIAFSEANEARLVEDGKIQSFYSVNKPIEEMSVGDIWIDTTSQKLYRYNGTNWIAVYDTNINEIRENVDSITERTTSIETDLGAIDLKVEETTIAVTNVQEQVAQQKINIDTITNTVSETETRLNNDYMTAEQVQAEIETTKEDIEILKQKQASTELTSESFKIQIDSIVNDGSSKVKTSTGYTFDDEGLKINKDNTQTGTFIDEAAVKIIDKTGSSQQNLLYAGYVKEGNTEYSRYIGQAIVASANMIVENYLVVPNSRFETYENPVLGGKGTGVFEV